MTGTQQPSLASAGPSWRCRACTPECPRQLAKLGPFKHVLCLLMPGSTLLAAEVYLREYPRLGLGAAGYSSVERSSMRV